MRSMALTDLIIMRRPLLQMLGIFVVIAVFLTIATGSVVAAAAAMAVMNPAMFVISIAAYDQLNHWESFRLCLPLNRSDVVKGRYLSTTAVILISFVSSLTMSLLLMVPFGAISETGFLSMLEYRASSFGEVLAAVSLGLAVSLWIPAISLPLSLRYGLTRMTRLAPMVVAFALALTFTGLSSLDPSSDIVAWLLGSWVFDFLSSGEVATIAILAAILVSALVYLASMAVALKLYKKREF